MTCLFYRMGFYLSPYISYSIWHCLLSESCSVVFILALSTWVYMKNVSFFYHCDFVRGEPSNSKNVTQQAPECLYIQYREARDSASRTFLFSDRSKYNLLCGNMSGQQTWKVIFSGEVLKQNPMCSQLHTTLTQQTITTGGWYTVPICTSLSQNIALCKLKNCWCLKAWRYS